MKNRRKLSVIVLAMFQLLLEKTIRKDEINIDSITEFFSCGKRYDDEEAKKKKAEEEKLDRERNGLLQEQNRILKDALGGAPA